MYGIGYMYVYFILFWMSTIRILWFLFYFKIDCYLLAKFISKLHSHIRSVYMTVCTYRSGGNKIVYFSFGRDSLLLRNLRLLCPSDHAKIWKLEISARSKDFFNACYAVTHSDVEMFLGRHQSILRSITA